MTHEGKIIVSVKNNKILGVHFNSSNNMESHMSSVASRIGLAFKKLKPFIVHASPKQRKTIINSKLRSIALYCSPLFFNESTHCKKRLESVLMTINKRIYNRNTYMTKYKDICHDIQEDEPKQLLLKTNTKFICKLMTECKVDQLLNLMIINVRLGSKVYMADPHKQGLKAAIIRLVQLYNALPLELKSLNQQRLKQKLTKFDVSFKDLCFLHPQTILDVAKADLY